MECFLKGRSSSECGSDRGSSDFVGLFSCIEDVSGHVASCHLSRESFNEYELILARAGFFDLTEQQIQSMKVCPKHRNNFGRFWRPLRSCQYPSHSGRRSQVKGNHVVTLQLSKEIQALYGKLVPIGSRKYFQTPRICFSNQI